MKELKSKIFKSSHELCRAVDIYGYEVVAVSEVVWVDKYGNGHGRYTLFYRTTETD